MTERFTVSIPVDQRSPSVAAEAAAAIKHHQRSFLPLFERLIDDQDARTTVLDDSLEVRDIQVDDSGGIAEIRFTWSFYAGCKNMDDSGFVEESLDFEIDREKGTIEFELELPPPRPCYD